MKRACLVCDEFQPRPFFRLTEPTPAEAAARRATAAIAAAAGDVPARGDASTPALGEDAGEGNAAAFAAAPGAGDHTVRPAAGANTAASRPCSAAPPGGAGAPQDPGDAAAPPLGETAAAGDAAALGALPAAAPAIASVAAIAAAEVPDMDGTVAVERKESRDSAALALGSLVGEQQPPLHLVLAPLLHLTRLTYVFGLPNVYVGALDGRLGQVLQGGRLQSSLPLDSSVSRGRRFGGLRTDRSLLEEAAQPSHRGARVVVREVIDAPVWQGRRPRAAAAVAAAPDSPLNLFNLRMTFQLLNQSAALVSPFFTTNTGAFSWFSSTFTAS